MDGPTGRKSLWKNLRQRLRLKGMGICGSSWSLQASEMPGIVDEEPQETHDLYDDDEWIMGGIPAAEQPCGDSAQQSMNLATALAVDRRRNEEPSEEMQLKSLMRLFEETDGEDVEENDGGGELGGFCCCVCMERSKGAAFIPCGHTYCRVCSREVWLNRGSCPLCNKPITEILDIF